ncbi:MAG: NAD(P)-binding domain-containing protein [Planctomycetes bacterium]|nr:NAD(P)-binding domain-containing protein [Planctomycetota bacterium]
MSWLFSLPVLFLAIVLLALLRRRHELRHHADNMAERARARTRGSDKARLQHPRIDLSACIGCGACVRACPEDGVLALAFGQAVIVHGARCVGHGLCAAACPTNAIALTLGDIKDRKDLPAVDEGLEAVGVPGLFLAGEITGFALVRTAVQHGGLVASRVAARIAAGEAPKGVAKGPLDLLVVGLGPAGVSCLLGAKERGLRCLGIDQAAEIGGTVAAYPRKKLVMTQPMDLPLHGRLGRLEYSKEELVELWQGLVAEHDLPVKTGVVLQKIERTGDHFVVTTNRGVLRSHHVCLAVGRRGSPQRLGVPGEDLPKVAYSLLDAEGYHGRSILVVGGGDSAIEAAMALAEQGDNQVTISYRRDAFSRLKARNEERIGAAVAAGTVQVRFGTVVKEITPEGALLASAGEAAVEAAGGVATAVEHVAADDVFVFAGGTPPFPLLEAAGVSFDSSLRPEERIATDRGTGLVVALAGTLAGMVALLVHRVLCREYYDLPAPERGASPWHDLLRPQGQIGLFAALLAVGLFATNLAYLARRAPSLGRWLPGSLKSWMNMHVATGLAALLFAVLHSGFLLRDSAGGHALLTMLVVVVAGVVGRWFYSFLPRAQNGRQQEFEEMSAKVAAIAGEWDRDGRGFGAEVRAVVERLADAAHFGRGFFARIAGLLRSELRLQRELGRLRARAAAEGIPRTEAVRVLSLAQRSHRLAMQLTHYEEVRGLLSTWRWLHRWLAVLLLLLTVVHAVTALRYGGVDFSVLRGGGGR